MNTMTADTAAVHGVPFNKVAGPSSPRRRAVAATMVGGLYVLLVLGAPLIVRYGPDPDAANAPAAVAVREGAAPRCASAPEYGHSCQVGDAVTD